MTATPVDPRFQIPSRRVVFLALALVALFWFARPVMLPFVVGAIVAYAFSPAIDSLQARTGRSRLLVVVMSYAAGLLVLAAIAIAFAGPVSREASLLIRSGPDALTTAIHQVLGADSLTIGDRTFTVEEISLQAKAALDAFLQTPEGALLAAQQLLHGLLDIVLILIVTFFLLLDGERFGSTVLRFIDPNDRSKVQQIAARTHVVVGQWMRGQLILVVFVSVIVTIVLGPILHLPNAAALGVMTGLLEVITFIGPIIAGTIVGIVALSTGGPTLAITAVVFLFVLRQFEDVVMMPAVLGRAVHLHPLVALFAVVVGSTAFGVVGTFLGLPVAAAISVAMHELYPEELGPLPDMTADAHPPKDAAEVDGGPTPYETPSVPPAADA
ncbi:MAG TPA: AI-2E family transporter [Patescibacteria group bacterium]|jgi:predicted PurR-regulated permease PerM|nr:AI-2E family transporter [Patescibacteria group bacterium]